MQTITAMSFHAGKRK